MSNFRFSLFTLLLIALFSSPVFANGPEECFETPLQLAGLTLEEPDGGWSVHTAALDSHDRGASSLLQDQYECLNRCEADYQSCVSGAGDDVSKRFMCGEDRFACTRSCDNAHYSIMEF